MVPMDYNPISVRRLLLEGLGRLIRHLAGLSEEVRHGLIHVISRSVSESIESTLYDVSRRRNSSMIETIPFDQADPNHAESLSKWKKDPTEYNSEDNDQDDDLDDDSLEDVYSQPAELVRERQEPIQLPVRTASTWWLTAAAGLCGIATWFGSAGLTPLATATSILAGSILVFLG